MLRDLQFHSQLFSRQWLRSHMFCLTPESGWMPSRTNNHCRMIGHVWGRIWWCRGIVWRFRILWLLLEEGWDAGQASMGNSELWWWISNEFQESYLRSCTMFLLSNMWWWVSHPPLGNNSVSMDPMVMNGGKLGELRIQFPSRLGYLTIEMRGRRINARKENRKSKSGDGRWLRRSMEHFFELHYPDPLQEFKFKSGRKR